jgi:hypothetical protein
MSFDSSMYVLGLSRTDLPERFQSSFFDEDLILFWRHDESSEDEDTEGVEEMPPVCGPAVAIPPGVLTGFLPDTATPEGWHCESSAAVTSAA